MDSLNYLWRCGSHHTDFSREGIFLDSYRAWTYFTLALKSRNQTSVILLFVFICLQCVLHSVIVSTFRRHGKPLPHRFLQHWRCLGYCTCSSRAFCPQVAWRITTGARRSIRWASVRPEIPQQSSGPQFSLQREHRGPDLQSLRPAGPNMEAIAPFSGFR